MSKYKTKSMPIIHIIEEVINILRYNIKQIRQIKDSLSSFENKVKH